MAKRRTHSKDTVTCDGPECAEVIQRQDLAGGDWTEITARKAGSRAPGPTDEVGAQDIGLHGVFHFHSPECMNAWQSATNLT